MKASDLRDLTWEKIQPMLSGQRLAVLTAFREHGPGTTERIASRIGMSILTFRPRATELGQLGLIRLVNREGTDGIYEAAPDARAGFESARLAAAPQAHQTHLDLV